MTNPLNSQLYNLFDILPAHILPFLQWLAQDYKLPYPLHFLDVGCGPGRLLQPCAALGWQVDALEPDADYYAAAAQIARQSANITVRQGGFEAIEIHTGYDLIAAINAPFAYLLTMAARLDALNRIFHALKPGGVLFLDMFNFLWILRHYRPPQESILHTESGDAIRRVVHHQIDWHDSTFTHTDTFYRNDERISTQIHRMAIITLQELQHLVATVGFERIQTYNNFAARKSQRINKGRIMLSAQKPL